MTEVRKSVLAVPGMLPLLATVAFTLAGFSLLLPVSPFWVVSGGASEFGAGSVTTTLMLFTIFAQLGVNRALRRFGWTRIIAVGLACLAVPAPFQAIAPDLALVLICNAFRGLGFGILTVCGATALNLLVPASERGRSVAAYGLASSLPQLLFGSSAPVFAGYFGSELVIAAGALPIVAMLWVAPLGARLKRLEEENDQEEVVLPGSPRQVFGLIFPALLALLIVTSTGGALLTFANQIAPGPKAATAALLSLTGVAVIARWIAGTMSDRLGTNRLIPALVAATGLGALILSCSLSLSPAMNVILLVLGAAVLGVAYGGLQSATLVRAFEDSGRSNAPTASVLWNVTYDFGTGAGALFFGAIAQQSSFMVALSCMAGLSMVGALATTIKGKTSRVRP